jgi:hypothetical protein
LRTTTPNQNEKKEKKIPVTGKTQASPTPDSLQNPVFNASKLDFGFKTKT